MKSLTIKTQLYILLAGIWLFLLVPGAAYAAVHGMSPRDGYVKTETGAPIPYIKVTEFTDVCPPQEQWAQNAPGCPYPTSCHVERSVRTDEKGYYYFPPDWPLNTNDKCNANVAWRYTCSNPKVLIGAVPDNVQANTSSLVAKAYAQENCTPIEHPTTNISDTITTDLTCNPPPQKPPACGIGCHRDAECAGAKDGCTLCVGATQAPPSNGVLPPTGETTTQGTCQKPPPTCGNTCTTRADCADAKDSCTECLPNDSGTGSSCKPVPACGTSCTKDSQCAGAKNGCNICSEGGKCTAFSPDMCKCDGMDFSVAGGGTTFFPGSDVTFIAFGKVEGANINVADLQSMSFSLYQSTLSDPNKATRLAQSTAITPEIVGNTGSKVRYKVSWNQKIPTTVPSGSLFRVQATIKCVAKPGVLGASTTAGASDYYTSIVGTINGILRNTKTVLGDTTENNQQAKSFFPGAKISEKSCSIIKFYFE